MNASLRAKLLEVLGEGGPRKPAILKALALHLGFGAQQFLDTINQLKQDGEIRVMHRQGGVHYGLKQRGFGTFEIAAALVVCAGVVVLLVMTFNAGMSHKQAEWDRAKLAEIAAAQARDADVSDAIKEAEERRASVEARATDNDRRWKEALRDSRRNALALGTCVQPAPERPDAGGSGSGALAGAGDLVGGGIRAPSSRDGAAHAPTIRLNWSFVGLYDGAYTGLDGQPLFGASAQFAGAPERADTASPYGLDDLAEVAGDNARDHSACLRWVADAEGKLKAAAAAWERVRP